MLVLMKNRIKRMKILRRSSNKFKKTRIKKNLRMTKMKIITNKNLALKTRLKKKIRKKVNMKAHKREEKMPQKWVKLVARTL